MAPIEQYLMDRDAEIALARSTAPDAISHDASVIVLTRHGYETAGKNGWVCWVGRGWMAMFDQPEFWNPKVRAAESINPPAARSVLPYAYKRTELLLAGHSQQEVIATIKATIDKKRITSPGAGDCLLQDVEGFVSRRLRRPQRPAHDVLRNSERRPQSTKNLGQESRSQTRGGLPVIRAFAVIALFVSVNVGLTVGSLELVLATEARFIATISTLIGAMFRSTRAVA